jgi:hypothetical protein
MQLTVWGANRRIQRVEVSTAQTGNIAPQTVSISHHSGRDPRMRSIRMIGLFGMLSAFTPLFASEQERKPSQGPAIGALGQDDLRSLPYMGECEFFRGPINGANTVFATRRQRAVALILVDGRAVTLQRDGKAHDPGCGRNVRTRERWIGDVAAVVLDYRATGPGAEACWFKGTMRVAVGGRTASTPISGACGC